jgi:hypothetical protein
MYSFEWLTSIFFSANEPSIIRRDYTLVLVGEMVVYKIMGRKGIKCNRIQRDRKKSASEMTEERKNKKIKMQQCRVNSCGVEGHRVLHAECLHIDGCACQLLSVLKINVLFFHSLLLVRLSLNFYRFSHFSFFVLEFNSVF